MRAGGSPRGQPAAGVRPPTRADRARNRTTARDPVGARPSCFRFLSPLLERSQLLSPDEWAERGAPSAHPVELTYTALSATLPTPGASCFPSAFLRGPGWVPVEAPPQRCGGGGVLPFAAHSGRPAPARRSGRTTKPSGVRPRWAHGGIDPAGPR